MVDKEFSLEIAILLVIKAGDPNLQIWKSMEPTLDLKATKETTLAISSSEREALSPVEGSHKKREGKEHRTIQPSRRSGLVKSKGQRKSTSLPNFKGARGIPARGDNQEEKTAPQVC